MPKIQTLNFPILYTTLVKILPSSMPDLLGQISYVLSDKMSFEVFSPIFSHNKENDKNNKNRKNPKF